MLTPWYPDDKSPNHGIFIQHQAKALQEHHQVAVISAKVDYSQRALHSYSLTEINRIGDPPEFRLRVKQSLPGYNQLNQLFITIRQSYKIGKRFKPDVIHASIGYPTAFCGFVLSKLLKVPFVYTEHTRVINNFRSAFHRMITIAGIKRSRKVMTVSKSLAREVQPFSPAPVIVVPNIVAVDKFKNVKPSTNAIPQLGFLGGMDTSVKGLDILLKALSGIKSEFNLHIGGRGQFLEPYKKMAKELGLESRCIFHGFIQPDAIPEFMQRIDFYVCASRYETFCVSLVEAIASGRPVVSTRCGGPEDFVTEANGIMCDANDDRSLKNAIERMMVHFREYDTDAVRGTVARFAPQLVAKELEAVYAAAIGE